MGIRRRLSKCHSGQTRILLKMVTDSNRGKYPFLDVVLRNGVRLELISGRGADGGGM